MSAPQLMRPARSRRARPRRGAIALAIGAGLLVTGVGLVGLDSGLVTTAEVEASVGALLRDDPPPAHTPHDSWTAAVVDTSDGHASQRFAAVGALDLWVPAAAPLAIGFHEAATSIPLAMEPRGRQLGNLNSTRHTRAERVLTDARPHIVMASRGRSTPPTSAVDILVRKGEPILAPVSGVVSDIRPYLLYGRHADHRLEIRPDRDPSLRVVMVHVTDPLVSVGDRVSAGSTVVAASARGFPFTSQIDRETEPERHPHVHLEVQPFDAPRVGDPPPEQDEATVASG